MNPARTDRCRMFATTAAATTLFWGSLAGMAVAAEPDGTACYSAGATQDGNGTGGGAFGQPNDSGHPQGGVQVIGGSHSSSQGDDESHVDDQGDCESDHDEGDQGDHGG